MKTRFGGGFGSARRHGVIALALAALLAGCDQGTSASSQSPRTAQSDDSQRIEYAHGPNDLVLRIQADPGFVMMDLRMGYLPELSLYGDGTLIVGNRPSGKRSPEIAQLQVMHASTDGMQVILRRAEEAGILDGDDDLRGFGPDMPFKQIYSNAGDGPPQSSIYVTSSFFGGSKDSAIRSFAQALNARTATWLSGALTPPVAYQPESYRLLMGEPGPLGTYLRGHIVKWPLDEPLETLGTPAEKADWSGAPAYVDIFASRCAVLTGDDLATVLPQAQAADIYTTWKSEGIAYGLGFEPILPGDTGC